MARLSEGPDCLILSEIKGQEISDIDDVTGEVNDATFEVKIQAFDVSDIPFPDPGAAPARIDSGGAACMIVIMTPEDRSKGRMRSFRGKLWSKGTKRASGDDKVGEQDFTA